MKLIGYILDHMLYYMLDYMLDQMIIGFMTMALQLPFFGISFNKQVIVKKLLTTR